MPLFATTKSCSMVSVLEHAPLSREFVCVIKINMIFAHSSSSSSFFFFWINRLFLFHFLTLLVRTNGLYYLLIGLCDIE